MNRSQNSHKSELFYAILHMYLSSIPNNQYGWTSQSLAGCTVWMMLINIPEEYFVVMIRLQEPGFGLYASYSLFHWLPRKSLLSNNQNIKIICLHAPRLPILDILQKTNGE